MRSPLQVAPPSDAPRPTTKYTPTMETAAPAQCTRGIRSCPSAADRMATTAGVVPMIRAALETLVPATPRTKQN